MQEVLELVSCFLLGAIAMLTSVYARQSTENVGALIVGWLVTWLTIWASRS